MKKTTRQFLSTLTLIALLLLTPSALEARMCLDPTPDGGITLSDVLDVIDAQGAECATDPGACLLDFNRNGIVDCVDIEIAAANYGPCPCLGDTNDDGDVDIADLANAAADVDQDCSLDINLDGSVDVEDVEIYQCLFPAPGSPVVFAYDQRMDLDGDGTVGLDDGAMLGTIIAAGPPECGANVVPDASIDALDYLLVAHRLSASATCP